MRHCTKKCKAGFDKSRRVWYDKCEKQDKAEEKRKVVCRRSIPPLPGIRQERKRMKQPYLECGKIVGTHGVNGGVRIQSWCDSPEVLTGLPALYFLRPDGGYAPRRVLHGHSNRGQAVVTLEGVTDMDAALALKNTVVYAAREDIPLPEGAAFVADMLGMAVVDADTGRVYGRLVNVEDFPSSQMYTVRTENGEVLFPAVKEFVDRVEETCVYIRPIPGMFS